MTRLLPLVALLLALPAHADLCTPCTSDPECTSTGGVCTPLYDGDYCTQSCESSACPLGFVCVDLGPQGLNCLPASSACTCLGDDVGSTRPCTISTPGATCEGWQECGSSGWMQCIPPAEVCDGLDNNCDGQIDEGYDPVCAVSPVPVIHMWGLTTFVVLMLGSTILITHRGKRVS